MQLNKSYKNAHMKTKTIIIQNLSNCKSFKKMTVIITGDSRIVGILLSALITFMKDWRSYTQTSRKTFARAEEMYGSMEVKHCYIT